MLPDCCFLQVGRVAGLDLVLSEQVASLVIEGTMLTYEAPESKSNQPQIEKTRICPGGSAAE